MSGRDIQPGTGPASRPAPVYHTADVPVRGGDLRVGQWGEAGPLVVAAHGITSSHQAWVVVGPDLGRDHVFVAPDLRGRGASRELPPPYGMAAHAEDLAAVVEAYGGGPAVLVGHSMGGFAVIETARRYPALVSRLVLVDGGPLFPLPPGVDAGAGDEAIAAAVNATIGAAYARLSMTFPTRDAYRAMWREHPSLHEWTPAVESYVDYDLVGEEPELRPACQLRAALDDARDLYAYDGRPGKPLDVPVTFLRAARGMFDEPDRPLYPAGYAGEWLPGAVESTVDGVNHYTILLAEPGAAAVAAAVRAA
jgi:pimeloyl-ACP methyl ester carboxylesterase